MRSTSALAHLALLLLFVAACSSGAAPTEPPVAPGTGGAATPHPVTIPRPPPLEPPPPPPGDMPSPDACTADADCEVVVAGPDPAGPCCDRMFTMRSMSTAYLRWAETYQRDHCAHVHCDALGLPGAQGADCAMQARCTAGRCGNACGETTTVDGPAPPTLSGPARSGAHS